MESSQTFATYMAVETVLVRMVPAFRLVRDTRMACTYGCAYTRIDSTHTTQ